MIKKLNQIFREIFLDPIPLRDFSSYDDYWEKRGKQEPKYRFVWVEQHIPEGASVLDIGCGDGAFLDYLKSQRPELEVQGIDGSDAAIQKLREKGLCGEVVGDLNNPDLKNFRNVDVIVAMELIEHLSEPELLMKEFSNTSAETFYITIPNLGFIVNRLRLALGGKMPNTAIVYHIKEHLRFWTVRDFHQWASHYGFKVTEYTGQNGFFGLWRIFPSLFARQMIYVLKKR
ncbi:MAG: methionine biosynthesis protein MetW [Rubritalea sp.]|jgi:methionine biosynthesis protein MetW|tara:strand:- start:6541 stop:7230 length:690 start_codon:yes stop_codon:yes gene_type:complete